MASANYIASTNTNNYYTAKIDSGATQNYIQYKHRHLLTNVNILKNGPKAFLPNKTIIQADREGHILLHNDLSQKAQKAYSFPQLTNESLISVGQLCDDNCKVLFDKSSVKVIKNNKTILSGSRSCKDKLYDLKIPNHNIKNNNNLMPTFDIGQQINFIIHKDQTKTDLARYLHATAFSPSISTFIKAIRRGNFVTWPGIDNLNLPRLLGTPMATAKGHLDSERKNLQSTKNPIIEDDNFPDKINNETHEIFVIIGDIQQFAIKTQKAYMDLTGRFPYKSSRGNQYLVIVYDYDANAIVYAPIKTRQSKEIFTAFKKCEDKVKQAITPKLYILDNECAADLKLSIHKNDQQYELVPPNQHRRNTAERAIRTFKNHLLAGLASCDPGFPIAEWDRILPQCELTLNLLRNSRINPKLSSWAYLNGVHNFQKIPMAPPGTKILIHSKPTKRASWAFHGVEGWYIGPSFEHYRCVKCYIPKTRSEVSSDTIQFIPSYVPIPEPNIDLHIRRTLHDLVQLLTSKSPAIPALTTESSKQAIIKISQLLNRDTTNIKLHHTTTKGEKSPYTITSEGEKSPHNITSEGVQIQKSYQLPPPQQRIYYNVPTPKFSQPYQTSNNQHNIQPQKIQSTPVMNYTYDIPSRSDVAKTLVTPIIHQKINHIYNENGQPMSLDRLLQSENAIIWERATSNEIGRLSQGINNILGNDVLDFILKEQVPKNKIVTYARMVCDHRPFKNEPFRVRLTVGGDRLTYDNDAASPASSLLESKNILNSTISQSSKGCRFMTLDIKDFFLKTMMSDYEYMRIHNKYFIGDIRKKYNIDNIMASDGYVYCRIKKGMYGLKQAARLAYDDLKNHLKKYGYKPDVFAQNVWTHESRPTKFCLCVDDFGVQYFSEDDANHLTNALKDKYEITIDKKGENFCGLRLDWNYAHGHVDISMPNFVKSTLHKLNYKTKNKRQLAPHKWAVPIYGKNRQYATEQDTSKLLNPSGIKYVQRTVGSFLYYARAVDNTILPALNEIALYQAKPTSNTIEKIQMLLDYLHTFPNAKIRFHASDMQLHIDSDAAYLVAPKAKSRIAGYYFLSDKATTISPQINGPIHIECKLLNHVVTSAAEAETAGLFYNAQTALHIKHILRALNHPQKIIPLKTDNSTAASFVTDTLKAKRSKSWDVRYHWLSEQQKNGTFKTFWDKGENNLADYHTKHHPPNYHQKVRPYYILKNCLINTVKHGLLPHNSQNDRKSLHARVCLNPALRTQSTNVPSNLQRTNIRYRPLAKVPTVGKSADPN